MARRSRAVQFHSAGQGRRRSFARTAAALHRSHASVRLGASIFARVYALVRRIPRGRVTSYGAIARALGLPQGARTVGWALSVCPDNLPWHRVVNARGQISWRPTGGYHLQRVRLQQEGVRFTRKGRIDLERFGWGAL